MNDNHLGDSVRYLIDALSVTSQKQDLISLLAKFNIRSAQKRYITLGSGAPLIVEDLQATMKQVSFDIDKIKLHKKRP